MSKIVIREPYIGSVLSVNHCYFTNKRGQRLLYPEAKNWMEALAWDVIAAIECNTQNLPLKVTVSGVFKDQRSVPDLHNLDKLIMDAVALGTGVNDRYIGFETGSSTIGETPELIIEISGA